MEREVRPFGLASLFFVIDCFVLFIENLEPNHIFPIFAARQIFYILFDKRMKVIEVRVVIFFPQMQVLSAVTPYIDFLSKTGRKWSRLRKGQEYYLAIFNLLIY